MNSRSKDEKVAGTGVSITLSGIVQKIFPAVEPGGPGKIQIVVRGAEDLYREIRLDNLFHDADGNFANLKPGDELEIIIATKVPSAAADQEKVDP
jgi:hypothetical protein